MPTKKRKYNARFPAGRIKKIMQTDEEVGKVAQAVPIIISRTLELFVESLLSKAMQVTVARNAKTLSPSHVKQCILAESKFDFLRDLVKNIPDVSAAEEKELMSGESSPNSSSFQDMAVPQKLAREDSNSSSSCDIKTASVKQLLKERIRQSMSVEEPALDHRVEPKTIRPETLTLPSPDVAIDLSKKTIDEKPVVTANFYQETLITDDVPHPSVITVNPTYASPQPSTSYTLEPLKIEPVQVFIDKPRTPLTPKTPISKTPVLPIVNIDFTKNITNPEIKLLDSAAANVVAVTKNEKNTLRQMHRQNSKTAKNDVKKIEIKSIVHPLDIDSLNSGNLQIDEDYDT